MSTEQRAQMLILKNKILQLESQTREQLGTIETLKSQVQANERITHFQPLFSVLNESLVGAKQFVLEHIGFLVKKPVKDVFRIAHLLKDAEDVGMRIGRVLRSMEEADTPRIRYLDKHLGLLACDLILVTDSSPARDLFVQQNPQLSVIAKRLYPHELQQLRLGLDIMYHAIYDQHVLDQKKVEKPAPIIVQPRPESPVAVVDGFQELTLYDIRLAQLSEALQAKQSLAPN